MRQLIPLVAWGLVPETQLRSAQEAIDKIVADLTPFARASRYEGTPGIVMSAAARPQNESLWESHCVFGASHPFAPPLVVDNSADIVTGVVSWPAAYDGQSGFVHGGALASAFDVMLGQAAGKAGLHIVTGTMTLRFSSSVPVDREVHLRSWIEGVEGRKVSVRSTLHVGDLTAVEATAVFITVPPARFGSTGGA